MSRRRNANEPAYPGWHKIDDCGVSGTYEKDGWTICCTIGWMITRPDGYTYASTCEQMETAVRRAEKMISRFKQKSNL